MTEHYLISRRAPSDNLTCRGGTTANMVMSLVLVFSMPAPLWDGGFGTGRGIPSVSTTLAWLFVGTNAIAWQTNFPPIMT